jgi:AICAR transformylase/IMP cyclohydrolase PurH
MQASYYTCRFSDSWSIYDGIKRTSRQLDNKEVEILKALFPAVIFDEGRILSAIQVTSINPNKLLQLTDADNSEKVKKKESIKS